LLHILWRNEDVQYYIHILFGIQALVMIQKIRDAFSELLEEVPWMDEETRIVAREKVSALYSDGQ